MGFLSSLLSGLKGGLDQGIMKALPNPGIDSGILRGVQSVAPQMAMGQAAAPSTMLGALLQRDANGHRSILGNLGGILKNPEALNYIGAALKDMSGDDGNLMAAEQNVLARQERAQQQQLAQQRQAIMSQALKNAYDPQTGRFDNRRFVEGVLQGGVISDPGTFMDAAKSLSPTTPKVGVEGGFAYSIDPETGQFVWGPQRPKSYGEEESYRHNRATEGIGQGQLNLGWARHRARERSGGYGTPGVGGPYVDLDPSDTEPVQ